MGSFEKATQDGSNINRDDIDASKQGITNYQQQASKNASLNPKAVGSALRRMVNCYA
jgi:hypothetical protein